MRHYIQLNLRFLCILFLVLFCLGCEEVSQEPNEPNFGGIDIIDPNTRILKDWASEPNAPDIFFEWFGTYVELIPDGNGGVVMRSDSNEPYKIIYNCLSEYFVGQNRQLDVWRKQLKRLTLK